MEAMLGAFCRQGAGKGSCTQDATASGPSSPNPMEAMLGAFCRQGALAGKGVGKGGYTQDSSPDAAVGGHSPPNPMEAMIGAFLGGNGCSNAGQSMEPMSAPPASPAADMTHNSPGPAETAAARSAFEESVNDLISMGIVSDRQTARDLLTQHGDISSVVAMLTEVE